MSVGERDELIRSLERLPVPAVLTELDTRAVLAVNGAAEVTFGVAAADLVGSDALALIDPRDRDATLRANGAMATRAIDAYQVHRRVVTPDGEVRRVYVSGCRVDDGDMSFGLWILLPPTGPSTDVEEYVVGATAVVLAVTDHDWQIDYMNSDADLLGAHGSELRGFPLLGLVHPSEATAFLAAIEHATTGNLAVTMLTSIRTGRGGWADRYCLIVPVCEHQPPRLGVVISAVASPPSDGRSLGQLEEHLHHVEGGRRAVQTVDALPALVNLAPGSELSARQTEIVARLAAGERPADIARSMFLSASTVRNHLTAVYRKFGVHSQAQLLAVLLRGPAPQDR